MKHDAQTTSWWSIGEWRLGWKVVAVFAVPMLVAMLLGGFRIQSELTEAASLNTSAERTFAVPAALRLEETLNDLAVAAASGTETATATAAVTTAMQEFATAGTVFRTDAALNDQIAKVLQNSQALVDDVAAGLNSPPRLVARFNEVSTQLWIPFSDLMNKSELPLLRQRGAEFAPLWGARRALANQHILYGSGNLDQQSRTILTSTAGAELASLGGLMPLATPGGVLLPTESDKTQDPFATLNSLRASAQSRIGQIGITASTSPLSGEIGLSLQSSSDQYDAITDAAIDRFVPTVTTETSAARSAALRGAALVIGALLAALVLALIISRSLVDPIRRLRLAALTASRHGLPEAIERIRAGEKVSDLEIPRVPIDTHEEIGQLARAVDDMHGQAITLAGEQATLRRQVNDMFETLSRRNKSLVEQQLGLIEQLEKDEDDPSRLENLFRLDHVATRMRRNSDNLLILSGTEGRRVRTAPIALADALRASVSGVEQYLRVDLGEIPSTVVSRQASADVVHLVTELLDNALRYSPPETAVTIDAARTNDGSVLVEIADLGIGMSAADLFDANRRLASEGEISPDIARHMGLFVISRISRRYDISVRLRPSGSASEQSGITAMVHLPAALLEAPRDNAVRPPTVPFDAPGFPTPVRNAPVRNAPVHPATPVEHAETTAVQRPAVSANGLPQRQPRNSSALTLPPPVSGVPAAVGSQSRAGALPPANVLPRRTPGNSGIPGVGNVVEAEPATAEPLVTNNVATQLDNSEPTTNKTAPRHLLGTPGPTNTAAFFSSRTRDSTPPRADVFSANVPEVPTDIPATASPIFARMVSEWLVDPTDEVSSATSAMIWTTEADEGWVAARASTDMPVTRIADSGLPIRDRGARLVPGTAGATHAPFRSGSHRRSADPDNVRRGWSDYQSGVSRGRRPANSENPASLHSDTHVKKDEGEQ
ncbi:ATP-binding protein [Rhodococcus sp. 24CO]|uniref:sensor histidine kinase n=1 Tax=Rhodococcus sp. 24CO TaxID=3117460 RepID=UPI003D343C61